MTSSANPPSSHPPGRRRVAGERRRSGDGRGIPVPPVLPAPTRPVVGEDEPAYAEPLTSGADPTGTGAAGTGVAEDEATQDQATQDETRQDEATPDAAPRRRVLVAALATGLALLLALTAGAVTLLGREGEQGATRERTAVNSARTSLEQLLSYNYETLDAQTAQTTELLTGTFKDKYGSTVETDIKPLATKNKTVVQARVAEAGVMRAEGDTVTVLAFVDQARASAELDQPTIDQNRVIVTMTLVGERWLISGLQAF